MKIGEPVKKEIDNDIFEVCVDKVYLVAGDSPIWREMKIDIGNYVDVHTSVLTAIISGIRNKYENR